MRDTSSPVFIGFEIQKLANVISTSKISFKLHARGQHIGKDGMLSVAAYSAMTLFIMSNAELHIFEKFTALKKGINCPNIQNEVDFSDGMLPQRSPRALGKRLRKF